jgi:hypothetical protein
MVGVAITVYHPAYMMFLLFSVSYCTLSSMGRCTALCFYNTPTVPIDKLQKKLGTGASAAMKSVKIKLCGRGATAQGYRQRVVVTVCVRFDP